MTERALQKVESSVTLQFSSKDLGIIKTTIAPGLHPDQFNSFIAFCQRRRLDPMQRQVYAWNIGGRMVIVVAIDGYRSLAARAGDYAGSDDTIFEYDEHKSPIKATTTVYKIVQGVRCPFTASARWDEYYPGKGKGDKWDKSPHTMLGKCSEALSLRKAWPEDLGGIYSEEEMDQAKRTQLEVAKPVINVDHKPIEMKASTKYHKEESFDGVKDAPYWVSEWKGVQYIHAREGDHFDDEFLESYGFEKKPKGHWSTLWTQAVENALIERAKEVEENGGTQDKAQGEIVEPGPNKREVSKKQVEKLRNEFRKTTMKSKEISDLLKTIVGEQNINKPEKWTLSQYIELEDFVAHAIKASQVTPLD